MSGTITETYYYLAPSPVTGMRRPFAMERLPNAKIGFAGDRYWYQSDGLDSVVALLNESGELVSPFLYDEYGQKLAGTTELQVFAYTSQDYDLETGFYHFYARYYDPNRGIWLTTDKYARRFPEKKPKFAYSYVLNNPIKQIDIFWYATQGEIDRIKPIISELSEIYGVPPEAIALVLELENKPGTSSGGRCPKGVSNNWCRQGKQFVNFYANLTGITKHCSGGDCSMGVGNVKAGTAKDISKYFADNYSESDMANFLKYDGDFDLKLDLVNDQMSAVYIAANLRWAMDQKGYSGNLTNEQIATIVQHHNSGSWADASLGYYNDALTYLENAQNGEMDLQFYDFPTQNKSFAWKLFQMILNDPKYNANSIGGWLAKLLEQNPSLGQTRKND